MSERLPSGERLPCGHNKCPKKGCTDDLDARFEMLAEHYDDTRIILYEGCERVLTESGLVVTSIDPSGRKRFHLTERGAEVRRRKEEDEKQYETSHKGMKECYENPDIGRNLRFGGRKF
jgi:hypothetical protein